MDRRHYRIVKVIGTPRIGDAVVWTGRPNEVCKLRMDSNSRERMDLMKRKIVRPRWTKKEVAILRKMYRAVNNVNIADALGRKVSSVVFKGHRLGLSKSKKRLQEMGKQNIAQRWGKRGKAK